MQKIIPVILCGGSGTRLWPLSRQKTPKQFLKLLDDQTLLQKTALRALDVLGTDSKNLVTVTLDEMAEETTIQLESISPDMARHVLREPEARNTAAAVAYAIKYVYDQFGADSYVWILPADHYIGNKMELKEAVNRAIHAADEGYLVTFGINPTRPETGYGYIQKAKIFDDSGVYFVKAFHEKPEPVVAEKFLESGDYLWNSGMLFLKVKTGVDNFTTHAPGIWDCVNKAVMCAHEWSRPHRNFYCQAAAESVETAVIEKADAVAVVPCDPKWSDIGSWESLWEVNHKDDHGNACKGNVYCEKTKNSMIMASDRLVTCVGLEDVIIIETEDSVLVANKHCGSALKNLVNLLRAQKRQETVFHKHQDHKWGTCRVVFESKATTIRECVIKPKNIYRHAPQKGLSEWVLAEGDALFLMGDMVRHARQDDIVTLKADDIFSIENESDQPLKLYEIRYNVPGNNEANTLFHQENLHHTGFGKQANQGKAA